MIAVLVEYFIFEAEWHKGHRAPSSPNVSSIRDAILPTTSILSSVASVGNCEPCRYWSKYGLIGVSLVYGNNHNHSHPYGRLSEQYAVRSKQILHSNSVWWCNDTPLVSRSICERDKILSHDACSTSTMCPNVTSTATSQGYQRYGTIPGCWQPDRWPGLGQQAAKIDSEK